MDGIIAWLQISSFTPPDILVIISLVVLEGLLSCDNAVVLALLVRDLPPKQQGKALRYGIWGAYFFRVVAIVLATYILFFWPLKIIFGVYLVWIAVKHFFLTEDHHDGENPLKPKTIHVLPWLGLFWSVVVWVELTDIAFSVDSIAAAVAISSKPWVLILGGFLGILAMRFAAQGFVKLLERFPNLESAAFAAVAVVGLKLLFEFPLDVLGQEKKIEPGNYAKIEEYIHAVEKANPPLFHIGEALVIHRYAPSEPRREEFPDDKTHQSARNHWTLRERPLVEVEGWLSSILIMGIFLLGFIRTKKTPPTHKEEVPFPHG